MISHNLTVEQRGKVDRLFKRYQHDIKQQDERDVNQFIEICKNQLINLLDGDVDGAMDLIENIMSSVLIEGKTLNEALELSNNVPIKKLHPLIKLINDLDKKANAFLKKKTQHAEEVGREVLEPVGRLTAIAVRQLNEHVLIPINEGFAPISYLEEVVAISIRLIRMATAVTAASKRCEEANKMLNFEYWLERQVQLKRIILNELDRMKGFENQFEKITINPFQLEEFQRKVQADGLTLEKYRAHLDEVLPYDEAFRRLSDHEQEKIVYELEKNHLNALVKKIEQDIRSRLKARRVNHKLNKDKIRNIIQDDPAIGLEEIFKGPKICPIDDFNRDRKIKTDLEKTATKKRKKLASRIFSLMGVGLGFAAIAASFFVAPPFVLIALVAGSVAGFLIAKAINPKEDMTEIAHKGIRYFAHRVHQLFNPIDTMEKKHRSAAGEKQPERQEKIKKKITELAFNRYHEKIKNDELEQLIIAEQAMLGKQGKDDVTQLVHQKMTRQQLIMQQPSIKEAKNVPRLEKFMDAMDKLESQVSEKMDLVGITHINKSVNEIGCCVRDMAVDQQMSFAGNISAKINLSKLKKALEQVGKLSAHLLSTTYKCARAQTILNVDVWLKRQLVERFQLQEEYKRVSQFIVHANQHTSDLTAYQALFENAINNSLSLNKFRKEMKHSLATNTVFLKLSDSDQVYLIAQLEKRYLQERIEQIEKDALSRANVEMSLKNHTDRNKLANHLCKHYLAYDVNNEFKNQLREQIRKPNPTKKDYDRNTTIMTNLKQQLANNRRKVAARCFMLIFAGLTLAAVIAGFALAPLPVIVGLIAGALACAIIAKIINKDVSLAKTMKQSFKKLGQKVTHQLSFWKTKDKMAPSPDVNLTPSPKSKR